MLQHIEIFDINFIKIEPYEAYSSKVDHFNKFGVMLCVKMEWELWDKNKTVFVSKP